MSKLFVGILLFFFAISFDDCFGQFACPEEYCDLPQCKEEDECDSDETLVPTLCSCCQICAVEDGTEGDLCGYGTCADGYECVNSQCREEVDPVTCDPSSTTSTSTSSTTTTDSDDSDSDDDSSNSS